MGWHQSCPNHWGEQMSQRKPLVRFDTRERAQLTSSPMPPKKKRTKKSKKGSSGGSSKPRVIKGRVNIRVAGYPGVQKVAPSQLIPFLPVTKLKAAAKKVLGDQRPKRKRSSKKKKKK